MKNHLFIWIFVLLIGLTTVSADALLENDGFWATHGNQDATTYRTNTIAGLFPDDSVVVNIAAGSNFQPLAADLNSDGIMDIITSNGNYIQIYKANDRNAVTLQAEYLTVGTQTRSYELVETNDNEIHIIGVHDNVLIYNFLFNGTALNVNNSANLHTTFNITNNTKLSPIDTFIKCLSVSGVKTCFWGDESHEVIEYNVQDNTLMNYTGSKFIGDTPIAVSGNYISFITDEDVDAFDGISLYKIDTHTISDIHECNEELLCNIQAVSMSGILGSQTIIYSYRSTHAGTGDVNAGARIIKYDGSVHPSTGVEISFSCAGCEMFVSNPVIGDFENTESTQLDLCIQAELQQAAAPVTQYFRCVDTFQGNVVYNSLTATDIGLNDPPNSEDNLKLTAADVDGDGLLDVITGYEIYKVSNATRYLTFSLDNGGQMIPIDLDGDSNLDLLSVAAGDTYVLYSSYVNNIPTLYNNISFGGYYGYPNPICKNSTINFYARDCGSNADCNYDNDLGSDTERIISDCGLSETVLHNGSFTLNNPTVACHYNETGSYTVTNYLQDYANQNDFTQFNTQKITINVIDGIPGSTCNQAGTIITSPLDNVIVTSTTPETEAIDDSIDATFGILFGTSQKMRLLVAMSIIIAMTITAGIKTNGAPMPTVLTMVMSTILVTFLGLLTIWVIILVLIVATLFMMFTNFISGGGSATNGGG